MSRLAYPSRESFAAQEQLETLVDQWGMEAVLRMLSDVCSDKASHLCENWQDTASGKAWSDRAELMYSAAHDVATKFNPGY